MTQAAATTETPLYSSRITKNYLEYTKKHYPRLDILPILEFAGMTLYQVEDGGHWFNQRQVDLFHKKLTEATGNPNIAREVGQEFSVSKSAGAISQYLVGFITPITVYNMLEKLMPLVSRAVTVQIRKIDSDRIEAVVKPKPGVEEKPYQCQNRLGTFESIAKLFTNRLAIIDHSTCIHTGGDCCRYSISWEKARSLYWKKVRNFTFFASLIAIASLSPFLLPHDWVYSLLALVTADISVAMLTEYIEKKELAAALKNQGDVARNFLDEINMRYNESLLIQEIGQAISSILEIDILLQHIMEVLEKRLDFERGMIMLANKERTRLIYQAGYGYSEEDKKYLQDVAFNLDHTDSKGPSILAFRKKTPLLINSVDEIEQDLSKRSLEFVRKMGTGGFICVPIIYEQEAIGILMVDNPKYKRLFNQSDLSLLSGISNQIAISINNAISYQKIQENQERFRSLSENAPDIIFTMDRQFVLTYVNPAWEKILGYPKEDVLGKSFLDFVKKDASELYLTILSRVWNDRETVTNVEGVLLARSLTEKFFNMNAAPNTEPSGRVTGIICIMTNMTEKRSLEAQLRQAQKMEAIGTLAGGIAHDFNNILGAVMGYTEMAIEDLPPESPVQQYLEQVFRSSNRAKDLIRQILEFSRQTEQEFKPLRVSPIVKEALKLLRASIPATIEIKLNMAARQDTILADPTQIHQVLMNLCTNAAHAMSERGGLLSISLGRAEALPDKVAVNSSEVKPGPYLELIVADTGHGMDAATMDRIFDPFFTTKKPGEGTGMGLSVVHGIVKGHGGVILVESRLDQGSTFSVYFPLYIEPDTNREQDNDSPAIGGNESILFVDDELPLAQWGEQMLKRLGYRVVSRSNGPEALTLFRAQPDRFDLVITDLMMPNMSGLELAREMRRVQPDIPIILCTGFSESITQQRIREAGIRDLVLKPIVTKKMAAVIRRALDKNEAD